MSNVISTTEKAPWQPDQLIQDALDADGERHDYATLVQRGYEYVLSGAKTPAMRALGVVALSVDLRTHGAYGLTPPIQDTRDPAERALADLSQLLALRLAGPQQLQHYLDVVSDPLMGMVRGLHGVTDIPPSEAAHLGELIEKAVDEAQTLAQHHSTTA
jgi:hypothetical protein